MKTGPGGVAIREIGQLFEVGTVAGLGEVQLLDRFVSRRDEPAFAALVSRHGPMVLGVCRRLLGDPLDVEDAFQATFLVLVRRAGSIRDRDRLAPWLFGVARRVATRARLDRSRRQARERAGVEIAATAPAVDEHRAELGRALVEEIDRLPESLRLPTIFCCVDGLSYEEAAERLESTASAIRGRLFRARERLRNRLTRRGFAPALGAVGALISAEAASAAVPATLFASTVRVAIGFSAGRAATAGAVPATVLTLAEGVIRTMILTKSKLVAATLVACGVAASGVGVFGMQEPTPLPPERVATIEQKLDRLIRILENQNRPKAAMESPRAEAPSGIPTPAQPPTPPVPPAGANIEGTRGMMGMMGGMSSRATKKADSAARLDAVEQRLEQLEARLNQMERRLRSLPSPGTIVPSTDLDLPPSAENSGRSPTELDIRPPQPAPRAQPK